MTAAVLAAIAAAEAEARAVLGGPPFWTATAFEHRCAEDRLRLGARDRTVLGRHHEVDDGARGICHHCLHNWPCPDAQAVIAYWQGETP